MLSDNLDLIYTNILYTVLTARVQFLAGANDFSLLRRVHTNTGAQPAS
jgi:hypothetical protein